LTEQGTWTNSPTAFVYQWEDCDTSGANCSAIAGATAVSYAVAAADVGATIRVVVSAVNSSGSSDPATSTQTGVVLPLAPVAAAAPTIAGAALAGQILTEAHGSWTSNPTAFAYQWEDCGGSGGACSPIAGATAQTYTLGTADIGHTIVVDETASNAGGPSAPSSSAPTPAVVAPTPPANQSPPAISGTGTDGAPLTASTGTWSGTAPIAYTYQWQRCNPRCAAIAGSTGPSYTPTLVDVGARLLVVVTARNGLGSAVAPSAQTGPIAPTPGQIQTQLLQQLKPSRGPEIAAVLKAGGYTLTFKALSPGVAQVDWYAVAPGAHLAAKVKPLLLATGQRTFQAAGTGQLRLALSAVGKTFLKSEQASHVRVVKVAAQATFTPTGGEPVSATSTRSLEPPAAGAPRCFGAASRNPQKSCRNPSLRFEVTPTPADALITPNAACTPLPHTGAVTPCTFGASSAGAADRIALLGDSHAETWRGAMTVVAKALNWYGISLTRSSCAYSEVTPILSASLVARCAAWRTAVVAWFEANPDVQTVFVTDNSGGSAVKARGKTRFATQVSGFLDAWHALPRSVKHIVVIRDSPGPGVGTAACVARAIAHHKEAGVTCALRRSSALHPDPAVTAAHAEGPRASVVDMSDFFCGRKVCPPVVGGVLVYKDDSHMTALYSSTLGPFLLGRVRPLVAGWTS
jgi:SGNH domain (fused to AT3 domains)